MYYSHVNVRRWNNFKHLFLDSMEDDDLSDDDDDDDDDNEDDEEDSVNSNGPKCKRLRQ